MQIRNRDLKTELVEGATDGTYMKPGGGMRGGVVESLARDDKLQGDPPSYMEQVGRHRPDLSHIG